MATLTEGPLAMDPVTISRAASSAVDAEGNATDARDVVFTGRGTWGLPSFRDITLADARGQVVSASLALPSGVAVFLDDLVAVRGKDYVVTGIGDVRTGQRLALREVNF